MAHQERQVLPEALPYPPLATPEEEIRRPARERPPVRERPLMAAHATAGAPSNRGSPASDGSHSNGGAVANAGNRAGSESAGAGGTSSRDAGCASGDAVMDPHCVDFNDCGAAVRWCQPDDPASNARDDPWPCFANGAIDQFFAPYLD